MVKCAQGFTLLELIVVIAIVAILAAIGFPQLNLYRAEAAQKEAATEVFYALRLARSSAVSHNREYRVAFDLDSRRYWLEQGDAPNNSSNWNSIRNLGQFSVGLVMATKADCSHTTGDGSSVTADNHIHFNPNGTCGSSGSANSRYVCVLDTAGGAKYRSGVPSTSLGRVKINRL